MRLYLDSNVLISFLREEIDNAFNLRYLDTERFFSKCAAMKHKIVVSDFCIFEVRKKAFLGKKEIEELLNSLGLAYSFVNDVEAEKVVEIVEKTSVHFSDASHIANAIGFNCDAIISWDKDFAKAENIIPAYSPVFFVQNIP